MPRAASSNDHARLGGGESLEEKKIKKKIRINPSQGGYAKVSTPPNRSHTVGQQAKVLDIEQRRRRAMGKKMQYTVQDAALTQLASRRRFRYTS